MSTSLPGWEKEAKQADSERSESRKQHQLLLPKPVSSSNNAQTHNALISKPKRVTVRVACNYCRRKKAACDGHRPSCKRCRMRGETCVYISETNQETSGMVLKRENDRMSEKLENMEELVASMRKSSPNQVQKFLHQLGPTTAPTFYPRLAEMSSMKHSLNMHEKARSSSAFEWHAFEDQEADRLSFSMEEKNPDRSVSLSKQLSAHQDISQRSGQRKGRISLEQCISERNAANVDESSIQGVQTVVNMDVAKLSNRVQAEIEITCKPCQLMKLECDGARPRCYHCSHQRLECAYNFEEAVESSAIELKRQIKSLRRSLDDHEQFLEYLNSMTDTEALKIIRRFKATGIVSTVLSSIEGSSESIYRPSEHATARSNLSMIQSDIDFELTALHHLVYPPVEPLKFSYDDLPRPLWGDSGTADMNLCNSNSSIDSILPYRDGRLKDVDFGYWTCVPITNDLAALSISHYLEEYHPIFGLFDADCFLDDLLNCKLEFCSSFLFHALMALACQSYSSIDPQASAYSKIFLRQANIFWDMEQSTDSATKLSALNLLSIAAAWNGDSTRGNHDFPKAIRLLATRMGLLDVVHTSDLSRSLLDLPPDQKRNMAQVAWGTYGWLTMLAQYHPKEPINFQPVLPIPERRVSDVRQAGRSVQPQPDYLGGTFAAISEFWVLAQEIDIIYNLRHRQCLVGLIPPAFAEAKYQGLLAWADRLPECMKLDEQSASHVYLFHALYHTKILDIFRPFLNAPNIINLRSFSSADSTSATVFAASLKQLKHLIYAYRTRLPRHMSRACVFATAVLHVNSVLIKQENTSQDPSWKYYFNLCFGYWKDAYVNYRVIRGLMEALLTLALQEGAFTGREAQLLLQEFEQVGQHHEVTQEALTDCMLDFNRGIEMREGVKADELAKRFGEALLFDRWTSNR